MNSKCLLCKVKASSIDKVSDRFMKKFEISPSIKHFIIYNNQF